MKKKKVLLYHLLISTAASSAEIASSTSKAGVFFVDAGVVVDRYLVTMNFIEFAEKGINTLKKNWSI
jgi:hypothetical protein